MKALMRYEVGRLFCGDFRRLLEWQQAVGNIDSFTESSGWLMRDFIIRGDVEQLHELQDNLRKYEP